VYAEADRRRPGVAVDDDAFLALTHRSGVRSHLKATIVAGQIAVGRVVFESLAATIDPFPRKPDAVLDWQSPDPADAPGGKTENPFAVLANLKTKD